MKLTRFRGSVFHPQTNERQWHLNLDIFVLISISLLILASRSFLSKFDPTEAPIEQETKASLALLSRMESDAKKTRREPVPEESVLNVRKAVRFASKGRGGVALGRDAAGGGKGKKVGKRK